MGKVENDYCGAARLDPLLADHHDNEHGAISKEDDVLFERLMLEVMQAGLSWRLVLQKRDALRAAFDGFDVDKVARYGDDDIERLMANDDIVRNRKKIEAAIHNAAAIVKLRKNDDDKHAFYNWIASQTARLGGDVAGWRDAMKERFVFIGEEIVKEFLVGSGILPGAHNESCPQYQRYRRALVTDLPGVDA